jgi:acetoacetyl-CoA reductase
VIGFTKALALENAKKGVTVNVIAPGYIDTEMVKAVPENVLEASSPDSGRPAGQGRGDRRHGARSWPASGPASSPAPRSA